MLDFEKLSVRPRANEGSTKSKKNKIKETEPNTVQPLFYDSYGKAFTFKTNLERSVYDSLMKRSIKFRYCPIDALPYLTYILTDLQLAFVLTKKPAYKFDSIVKYRKGDLQAIAALYYCSTFKEFFLVLEAAISYPGPHALKIKRLEEIHNFKFEAPEIKEELKLSNTEILNNLEELGGEQTSPLLI